jgi:hypothetical protein
MLTLYITLAIYGTYRCFKTINAETNTNFGIVHLQLIRFITLLGWVNLIAYFIIEMNA